MTETALYISIVIIVVLFGVIGIMMRKNIEQRALIHELANKIRSMQIRNDLQNTEGKNEKNSNSRG